MSVQSQMVSFYSKEVVPQNEFEKGTWWRDGFWRYARFKNMSFFLGSHVRSGGGGVVISGILRYVSSDI